MKYLCFLLFFYSFGFSQNHQLLLQNALLKENGEGDLKGAVVIYEKIAGDTTAHRELRAQALLHIGICWEKLGKDTAEKTYQRILSEFADQQGAVNEAKMRLAHLKSFNQQSASGLTVKRLWPEFQIVPKNLHDISPNGKFISGMHHRSGDLCLFDIESKEILYLTDNNSREQELMKSNPGRAQLDSFYNSNKIPSGSAWSGDGNQLAFFWCSWDGDGKLYLINIDGTVTDSLSVFQHYIWPSVLDWSLDDKNILFTATNEHGAEQLLTFDLNQQEITTLIEFENETSIKGEYSPDGLFVAYAKAEKGHGDCRDIYIRSTSSGKEKRLLENSGDDFILGWIKENQILFASDRSGSMDTWSIEVKQGEPVGSPRLIKRDIGGIVPIGISENGTFYYAIEQVQRDIYWVTLSNDGKKILNPPVRLTQKFIGSNSQPVWSPDGTRLAYISRRGIQETDPYIVIRTLENEAEIECQTLFREINSLSWGLDGLTLLLTGIDSDNRKGIFEFYLSDKNIKSIYFFPENKVYGSWAAWLPGMEKIIFTHRLSGLDIESKIKILEVKTQQEKEIDNESTWTLCEILDPQKKHLTFRQWGEKSDNVVILPVEGGERRTVAEFKDEYINSITWAPVGKKIYIALRNDSNNCRLVLKELESAKLIDLGLKMDFMSGLQIHPDGKKLAFQAMDLKFEIWAMENY